MFSVHVLRQHATLTVTIKIVCPSELYQRKRGVCIESTFGKVSIWLGMCSDIDGKTINYIQFNFPL